MLHDQLIRVILYLVQLFHTFENKCPLQNRTEDYTAAMSLALDLYIYLGCKKVWIIKSTLACFRNTLKTLLHFVLRDE